MEGQSSCREEKVHFYFYVKVRSLKAALFAGAKVPLWGEEEIKERCNKQGPLSMCD